VTRRRRQLGIALIDVVDLAVDTEDAQGVYLAAQLSAGAAGGRLSAPDHLARR